MHVFLETDRLILRRFTEADVELLHDLDSDPEVLRYVTGGPPAPREEIRDDILPAFLGYYARFAGYGFWAALERSSGAFLGWFHFRPLPGSPPDEPELGYRLRRAAWGQGYGTEGACALIDHGFGVLGVRRVVASAAADNIASRRVMEKSGLTLVRTYRMVFPDLFDGVEQEDVEYALTRDEWERQRAARSKPGALSPH